MYKNDECVHVRMPHTWPPMASQQLRRICAVVVYVGRFKPPVVSSASSLVLLQYAMAPRVGSEHLEVVASMSSASGQDQLLLGLNCSNGPTSFYITHQLATITHDLTITNHHQS